VEERGCLIHAAGLYDRHQHMQIVKLQTAPDAIA